MAVESTVVPSDEELSKVVVTLKEAHPSLGVAKLLAQLKLEHPTLAVSEKRLRKTLAPTATAAETEKVSKDATADLVADTGLDASLDVSDMKIKVKMFKGGKGKGLVAREKILEGEAIWSENPWISTTSPSINEYINRGGMCTHCLSILQGGGGNIACADCGQTAFCNRLCYSRREVSASHHDLLCPGLNPGCVPLLEFIQQEGWRDLECAARILALWRAMREEGDEERLKLLEDRVWKGMARVNQLDKLKERSEWALTAETRMADFHKAHTLLLRALNPAESKTTTNAKTFRKLLRKRGNNIGPLTEAEESRWFSFDSFCQLIGLAGLNQEDSGGLYAIHAHLNHDCDPNVRVRNLPKDFTCPEPPSDLHQRLLQERGTNRLTMIARRNIHPGEELTIAYVDFGLPRSQRREHLREVYGFWCHCVKCRRQEGKPEPAPKKHDDDHEHGPGCSHDHEQNHGHDHDQEDGHNHGHAHEHGPGCSHD